MKHNSGNRRSRSRGGKQRHGGGGGRNNYDSNGPGGKVRGTAQQVLDKYLALARDAQSSGDRIGAESFFQFAEHYYRVLNADGANNQAKRDRQAATPAEVAAQPVEGNVEANAAETQPAEAAEEAEAQPAVDPADQPQPDIADMIPPAIEVAPAAGSESAEEPAPKPRRRRRTKTETPAEETETAQAS